jgi:hypothetical protein
MFRLFTLRLDR